MVPRPLNSRPLCLLRSLVLAGIVAVESVAPAQQQPPATPAPTASASQPAIGNLYVREYRVSGSKLLSAAEIGETVYPYLGPGRTTADIEKARKALEETYQARGYPTVSVTIPPQTGRRGIIRMEVVEARVGQVRVHGADWYLPSRIRQRAPSLAPGKVPNFEEVQRDLVALNQSPDLKVTIRPLTPGADPGVVDFDLDVEDKPPLHGSIEVNNRYSANTVPLRVNGSVSYGNLWQEDHVAGMSFQVAPERLEDGEVYSAFYSLPLPGFDDTTLTLLGTRQSSDISTLGGATVVGRGRILGFRVNTSLPQGKSSTHSVNFGMDYKHFDEDLTLGGGGAGGNRITSPIDYYPISLNYSGNWVAKNAFTSVNMGLNWHFRGMGSSRVTFDNKRFNADGGYIYARGDITHTRELAGGFQAMGKVTGQIANKPLINTEQISAGGQSSVRGYLESSALGDNGVIGTLEFRTPSFIGPRTGGPAAEDEWRAYAFAEAARVSSTQSLPDQQDIFDLASVGIGTRLRWRKNFNGSLDAALPLSTVGPTTAKDIFLSFRLWMDF
jgi:hemolysin activation/secretion protein